MGQEYTRTVNILGEVPIAGQIILHDDFEGLLKWTKTEGTGDSIFELDPTFAKHGNQSLHLKTRVTGATTGDKIEASRLTHLIPSKVLSFASSFSCPNFAKVGTIHFSFVLRDNITNHFARLRYTPATPKWEYYNTAGSYTEIPSLSLELAANTWHLINLKVNFATSRYISAQVNHLIADLSAIAFQTITVSEAIRLQNLIQLLTVGNDSAEIWIDDVIIHEI